ncbi:MAG: acyl-CoA-binding protein [Chitinophagaceae bacterium]|nr:acyl-CoA-binding protein [Chitinophagaceae bacterium]
MKRTNFEKAITDSKSLTEKPGNDILLQLYSLFKQSTEGDISGEAPSNPFDFVNKAKYDAWAALKGKSSEETMQQYIDLVNKLKGA